MQPTLFDMPSKRAEPSDIIRSARLSACGQYRWSLQRVWGAGPYVCWVMLNPSTADHRQDDPTVRRCIHFTNEWGYRALRIVNLYPFRTPNPAALRRWADWLNNGPDWYARDRIVDNLYLTAAVAQEAAMVVAAWGAGAPDDDWIEQVIDEIRSCAEPPALYCLGKTAGGDPKHPMARGRHRVPDDQAPILWRAA